ncbi:restriction endonuclease subunit S [bacterium]|nr:restriction endonuclease subunit S [bacterium]
MSYKKVKLGEIAGFVNGYAFKPSHWGTIGKKIIRIQNLTDINKPFNRTSIEVDKKYNVTKGDILVSWSATLDVFEWNDDEALLNQHIFKVVPDFKILRKDYFKYALKRTIEGMLKFTHGSTMKHINRGDFLETKIPLPPLEEQKRIAAILDKADALRRKRQQAIDLSNQFLRSVFLDMFGDPVTNPKGWKMDKVGRFTECIVPGRDKPKSFTGTIPWVTTNDLMHLDCTSKPQKFIGLSSEEISQVNARIIPAGSVLMTCVGDLGVISIAANEMVINQQLHSFQCSKEINNLFLMFALSFQKHFMFKMASNTTLPYMNKTICNSIPIIVPVLSLQMKFANVFTKAQIFKQSLNSAMENDTLLFTSLSQKAFKGEL